MDQQQIEIELPSGRVFTVPAGTPPQVIEAMAQKEIFKDQQQRPSVPFKDGMRPDTGTHLAENSGPGLTGAMLYGMIPSSWVTRLAAATGLGAKQAGPKLVQRTAPAIEDIAENVVNGGVKNNFKGRVTFDKGNSIINDRGQFDRALQEEMKWIQSQKATNPTANFSRLEYPPGAGPQTPPDMWKMLLDAKAELEGASAPVSQVQSKIAMLLDDAAKAKLRKPK